MKENGNKRLQTMCIGCRYNEIKTGKEFICNRPGITPARIAEEVVNAFFGVPYSCHEQTNTETK